VKPLACDLAAFDAAERRRHDTLRRELAVVRGGAQELPDGITLERRCGPFLSFSLRFDADPPSIRLELVGGEGVKRFLQSQLEG
jgi:hypothetical protein